jgi:hypothetical protein
MAAGDEFLPEICKIKHETIDKDISEIKNDIEEIKNMTSRLTKEVIKSHINLKNKIILNDVRALDKIDDLVAFDKALRGNGEPGVWESVRTNKESIKATRKIGYWFITAFIAVIVVLSIITLGGEWEGIGKKEEGPKIKQVEPSSKFIISEK